MDGRAVASLGDGVTGRWLVETASGSLHRFDLDEMVYARDGAHVVAGIADAAVHPILEVTRWPRINATFQLLVDLDDEPVDVTSGYVTRIVAVADQWPRDLPLVGLLEQIAGAPPTNAWLLIGDEASYPTPAELDGQRRTEDPDLMIWTSPRQIQRGDLVFIYFVAPIGAVHFVSRAMYPPVYDASIEVNARRTVDSHQWWTELGPLVEIPAVPFGVLEALHGGNLILRGKPTHYLKPEVVDAIVAGLGDLDDDQRLVLQRPVGDPDLPDPATMTLDDLRRISSGALAVEAAVEQYVVEPLMRLCLDDATGFELSRQFRPAGGGIADYAVVAGGTPRCMIEVKLGVKRDRNGSLADSPDLAQILRYMHAADTAGVLIDANEIILIDRGSTTPWTTIDRSAIAHPDLVMITDHLTGAFMTSDDIDVRRDA